MMHSATVFGLALVLSVAWAAAPISNNSSLSYESGSGNSTDHDYPIIKDDGVVKPKDDEVPKPMIGDPGPTKSEETEKSHAVAPTANKEDDINSAPVAQTPLGIEIDAAYLYTKGYEGGGEYELISAENDTIIKSNFQAGAKTYVIIHGFVSRASKTWIISLKDKILERDPGSNVVAVGWGETIGYNYSYETYNKTLEFIPGYGASVARLVTALHLVKRLDYKDVHAIGLNLGAHIAGFAGKKSPSPFGRITGLEPARVGYSDSAASQRLDKSDAYYVDIIHTNSCNSILLWDDCFGIRLPIGHTDFFPNGGDFQPACKNKPHSGLSCDHMLATDYFVESFAYTTSDTRFLARPAKNYHAYCVGPLKCSAAPQYMGILADSHSQGDHFLNTSTSRPYALEDPNCPSREHKKILTDAAIAAIVISVLIFVFVIILFVVWKVKGIWKKKSDAATDPLLGGGDDDPTQRIIDGQEQPRGSSILAGVARGFADV